MSGIALKINRISINFIGWVGAGLILAGLVGAGITGPLVDKTHAYKLTLKCLAPFVGIAFLCMIFVGKISRFFFFVGFVRKLTVQFVVQLNKIILPPLYSLDVVSGSYHSAYYRLR